MVKHPLISAKSPNYNITLLNTAGIRLYHIIRTNRLMQYKRRCDSTGKINFINNFIISYENNL